jgi:hypothetical protein
VWPSFKQIFNCHNWIDKNLSLFALPWEILNFDLSWGPLSGITDNVLN